MAKQAETAAEEVREIGVECLLVQGDVAEKGVAARIVKEVLDNMAAHWTSLVNNAALRATAACAR